MQDLKTLHSRCNLIVIVTHQRQFSVWSYASRHAHSRHFYNGYLAFLVTPLILYFFPLTPISVHSWTSFPTDCHWHLNMWEQNQTQYCLVMKIHSVYIMFLLANSKSLPIVQFVARYSYERKSPYLKNRMYRIEFHRRREICYEL